MAIRIVPFHTVVGAKNSEENDKPWKWAATFSEEEMLLFWGCSDPKSAAAGDEAFARCLGENVLFDFQRTASGGWMVFFTDDRPL